MADARAPGAATAVPAILAVDDLLHAPDARRAYWLALRAVPCVWISVQLRHVAEHVATILAASVVAQEQLVRRLQPPVIFAYHAPHVSILPMVLFVVVLVFNGWRQPMRWCQRSPLLGQLVATTVLRP